LKTVRLQEGDWLPRPALDGTNSLNARTVTTGEGVNIISQKPLAAPRILIAVAKHMPA